MDDNYNKNGFYKNAMNYGLILALAMIILTMAIYFFDATSNKYVSWLGTAIIAVTIYIGNKTLRDQIQGGQLSYGRSVGSGVLIAVFSGFIMSIFVYIFYTYIAPEAIQEILDIAEQDMYNKNLSDQEIEMGMSMLHKFTTPGIMAISSIFGSALQGVILSLILSIFLKKEANPFAE
ncbi:MAG: DUF4199 domain-containing protein [Bacteroidales bacterium]|nr:DUF4199 domain-containing protein [Bacteroidales bacterium]